MHTDQNAAWKVTEYPHSVVMVGSSAVAQKLKCHGTATYLDDDEAAHQGASFQVPHLNMAILAARVHRLGASHEGQHGPSRTLKRMQQNWDGIGRVELPQLIMHDRADPASDREAPDGHSVSLP